VVGVDRHPGPGEAYFLEHAPAGQDRPCTAPALGRLGACPSPRPVQSPSASASPKMGGLNQFDAGTLVRLQRNSVAQRWHCARLRLGRQGYSSVCLHESQFVIRSLAVGEEFRAGTLGKNSNVRFFSKPKQPGARGVL
jgi:hypothetical protein